MVWYGWVIFAITGSLIYIVGIAIGTRRALNKVLSFTEVSLAAPASAHTDCLKLLQDRLRNDLWGKDWKKRWEDRQQTRGL